MTVLRKLPEHRRSAPSDGSGSHLLKPFEGAFAHPDHDEIADALLRYVSEQDRPASMANVVSFADPRSARGESRDAGAGELSRAEALTRFRTPQGRGADARRRPPPAAHPGPMVRDLPEANAAAEPGRPGQSSRSGDDVFAVDARPPRRSPGPYRHGAPGDAHSGRSAAVQNRPQNSDIRHNRTLSRAPSAAARPEPKIAAAERFRPVVVGDEDEMRQRRMAVYFGKRPLWTAFLLFAGALLIFNPSQYHPVYGFELTLDRAFFVGLAAFLAAVYFRYMRVQQPTDEEVDEWTADDLKAVEARALELIDLDGRQVISEPVVLTGFPEIERLSGTFHNSRYGKDNILRFTPRAMTVLRFTRDVVVTYQGAADLITGQIIYERTSEFFYREIASVGLQKSGAPRDIGFFVRWQNRIALWRRTIIDHVNRILSGQPVDAAVRRNMREVFQIRLLDGETINIVLRDGRLAGRRMNDEISTTSDDRIIGAVREFIARMKNEQLSG